MALTSMSVKNDILYLALHDRIDSSNAAAAERELLQFRAENPALPVVIDAAQLAYISSAGLRIIIRLRKENSDLKIINVSPEVYEIFDMTGFTEMLTIEKAYRKLSVEGCEIIGRGANGEVYRLDADTIVKVYLNPDALPDIHRERELARRAFVLGIPTAIPYDVVKVGDGYGSVFELLNAKSFSKILAQEPERLDEIVGMFVELLKKIHATVVSEKDFPNTKARVLDWADFLKDYLPAEKWGKLHSLIAAVPENLHMLHGDYHTKNVMLQNGEVLLIDMDTLAYGDPVFEFASIFNAFCGFSAVDHSVTQSFLGLSYEIATQIWQKTLQGYFNTDDASTLQAIEDKSALVGYTRLMRRTIRRNGLNTEQGQKEIAFYKEQIETLLDRVDNLILA